MTYTTRIANKRIFAKICLLSFRSIIPIITFTCKVYFRLLGHNFYPCFPMLTHVYMCLAMFTRVYLCLPQYTPVFLCLPIFDRVYLCLPLFTCACLPMFSDV